MQKQASNMLDYTRMTRRNYWLRNKKNKKDIINSLFMTKLNKNINYMFSIFNSFKFILPEIKKIKQHSLQNKHLYKANNFKHSIFLEWFFFSIPSITILKIIIPSLALLCETDTEIFDPDFQIKVQGSQWYWTYDIMHDL